jgi:uncharacterized protein YjbI with pentapeptide repeats
MNDARLTEANLTNAKLMGARLDDAKWMDGTRCKEGSIGECKK